MKNKIVIWSSILLFHLLFWNTNQGLNILLFTWILSGALFITKSYVVERKEVKLLLLAWNVSALFFVIHGSLLNLVVYWGVFVVFIGFLQKRRILFWGFGILESIWALMGAWLTNVRISWSESSEIKVSTKLKRAKLLLIPLLIIIPFYFIYTQANADFATISNSFWIQVFDIFELKLNWARVRHFILGLLLVFAAIGKRNGSSILYDMAKNWRFDLKRTRRTVVWRHKMLALKQEYQMAIYSFISLNVLLVFINIIDITKVWFSFEERSAAQLSQYVHQGTYLLILSILLAMGVVLGFLRKNLNFYKNNKMLLQLIYLWLAQNAFLAISVAIRNGHYISRYGLAEGRIVVIFFLLLVLYGLYSMYQKVRGTKTIFFLVQKNGWAFIAILLLVSTVNWGAYITRYNLKYHPEDTYYLTNMLHNNLVPLIKETQGEFNTPPVIELGQIEHKIQSHIRRWEDGDWRNWTWSGYRQYQICKNSYLQK